jgi:hypothetical protein
MTALPLRVYLVLSRVTCFLKQGLASVVAIGLRLFTFFRFIEASDSINQRTIRGLN